MITNTITMDYSAVPMNQSKQVQVLLSLKGDGQGVCAKPLNISIALDRSGSMEGDKMEHALKASEMLANLMNEQDTFSLITFDYEVETVIEATKGVNKEKLPEILKRIHARGNTCLSGGYLTAVDQVKRTKSVNEIARVLLLSDGQANGGVSDRRGLERLVRDTLESAVTTTTFGLGDDFDEELMTAMSEEGGGNAYFIDQPQESLEIFQEELDSLRQLVATGCTVRFSPQIPGIQVKQRNSYQERGSRGWLIGDLSHATAKTILVELIVPAMTTLTDELLLGSFDVSWLADSDERERESLTIPVAIAVMEPAQYATLVPNTAVQVEAALLLVVQVKKEVRGLCLRRQARPAILLLDDAIEKLIKLESHSADLADEIKELRTIKRRILEEGTDYLDAKESKYMHYMSLNLGSGNKTIYQKAKSRYARFVEMF